VHFTSRGEWDEAKALGVPLRGIVIPLGVDGAEGDESGEESVGVGSARKIILFLSRLDPKKNVEGLLKAVALVRQRHAHAVLVIAGDGPAEYVRSLQALAQAEGIAEVTTWAGYIDGQRKWNALTAADIFVLPSFSENFGIAAVEALIAGRPCIVGSGVAIADTIARAGAGLVTEPDPSSIANALDRLLGDEALCREMGVHAKELADREYSSGLMAKRLVELYSNIAGFTRSCQQSRPTGVASPLDSQ
jgi:glycosyltransferase involved in cell wall biosynthesis